MVGDGGRGVHISVVVSEVVSLPRHTLFHAAVMFRIQPANITVNPDGNGTANAAFACSVTINFDLNVTIRWRFTPDNSTSSSTLSDEDENVTILGSQTLADPGTSILILESVSAAEEGLYSCEVEYCCGTVSSDTAQLTYDGQ